MSQVITAQIQEWRRKAREGTLTVQEARAAVDAIRVERLSASEAGAAKKSTPRKAAAPKAAKPVIDSNALLNELF